MGALKDNKDEKLKVYLQYLVGKLAQPVLYTEEMSNEVT